MCTVMRQQRAARPLRPPARAGGGRRHRGAGPVARPWPALGLAGPCPVQIAMAARAWFACAPAPASARARPSECLSGLHATSYLGCDRTQWCATQALWPLIFKVEATYWPLASQITQLKCTAYSNITSCPIVWADSCRRHMCWPPMILLRDVRSSELFLLPFPVALGRVIWPLMVVELWFL